MNANSLYMANYLPITATDLFAACFTEPSNPTASKHSNYPVYMAIVPRLEFGEYLTTSRASSSHGSKVTLRFKPGVTQKIDLKNRYKAVKLCTFGELTETLSNLREAAANGELTYSTGKPVSPKKLNLGHAAEFQICERWGLDWEMDDSSHTIKGDISLDGIEYQVKWQTATLTI